MNSVIGTPYLLASQASSGIVSEIKRLEDRVGLLRSVGKLTDATLKAYYGEKRFEQIAESNAIEGSPLSVGETELAVLKGVTISGHDPGWSRDAQALDRALTRLAELAGESTPTDIPQIKELHELILGDRPSAGAFRAQPVRISGSLHRPPDTWDEIMTQMEDWERWSRQNSATPALLRSTVLHAWLAHIHPFIDGNGRTARAVMNLELIRSGFPPIIIRRTRDRDRYIDALQRSDEGNIAPLIELFADRLDDALRDLERSAKGAQGYDVHATAIRKAQEGRVAIWNAALGLLAELIRAKLVELEGGLLARTSIHRYETGLLVDDFIRLCNGESISKSWCFRLECAAAGLAPIVRLAWLGFRSDELRAALPKGEQGGPAVLWSRSNPADYPPWVRTTPQEAPGAQEFTLVGDQWLILKPGGVTRRVSSMELADILVKGMLSLVAAPAADGTRPHG